VYVDDLTIAGTHLGLIEDVKARLSSRFKMKDLGEVHYLLKMEIRRDRKRKLLSLSQHQYVQELLKRFNMEDCSTEPTPQAKSVELVKEEKLSKEQMAAQPFDFRGLVGSLMYLVRGTRPDIANAVRELSKFLSCYNRTHWRAAQRVLKYLKGTSTYGLVYDGTNKEVTYELYTDASFANANEERRSVTGYVTILADACVSWKSGRQDTVSLHTAQSELIAISEGIKESEWLWQLLEELGFGQKEPIVCWCDNTAAISIVKDPTNHSSTKHIDTRSMYAREVHEKGRITVKYCNTKDMVADALTKALPQLQFEKLRELMGVRDLGN
jgi:hypothetical protein